MRTALAWPFVALVASVGACGIDSGGASADGDPPVPEAGAPTSDAGAIADGGAAPADVGVDAPPPRAYSCRGFTSPANGLIVDPNYRATIVNTGLDRPVALAFAGGAFGGKLYAVNQNGRTLASLDPDTGEATFLVAQNAWGARSPTRLTALVWDAEGIFDGNLYVGDQGDDDDGDSVIYRVTPAGEVTLFASEGPGLDDVFALAFAPRSSAYLAGLYATGDSDNDGPQWGRFDAKGTGTAFSDVPGTQSIAFVPVAPLSGALLAARPNGGGFSGDNEIVRISASGERGDPLATGLAGIHAVTYSPGGAFGTAVYAASWNGGRVYRIDVSSAGTGAAVEILRNLDLSEYDANAIAISPDGSALFVVDRGRNRVICVERLAADASL